MTRVNCLSPEYLLDEHVKADVREGLRPLADVLAGKDNTHKSPPTWILGEGHVIFHRKHLAYTIQHWMECSARYKYLGFKGFNYEPYFEDVPTKFMNDYVPTVKDLRSNLARIICRWRKRNNGKRGIKYHYEGKLVDTYKDMVEYIKFVKEENRL